MKEYFEIFKDLDQLKITLKEDIDKCELESFLGMFFSIKGLVINGICEEEKKELAKEFFNIL